MFQPKESVYVGRVVPEIDVVHGDVIVSKEVTPFIPMLTLNNLLKELLKSIKRTSFYVVTQKVAIFAPMS